MRGKRLVWLGAVAVVACGDVADTPLEKHGSAVRSPSDRIIVWQQNIEAMKAGAVSAPRLTDAMREHPYQPDIVILQEAWQKVLCGTYRAPAAIAGDVDVNNWVGSLTDANGLSKSCRLGRAPRAGSLLQRLGAMWGGAANVDHRRPFSNTLGQHTATGTAIIWDKSRFVFQDDFLFHDGVVPGCANTLERYKRVAVLLRDTRRTASRSDDRMIAVASMHYGSTCPSGNNEYAAEQMVQRWGTFGGKPLDLRIITGDFNLRVDETSATYAERRREEEPRSWYTTITSNTSWIGGDFLDTVKVRNPAGAGDAAPICGQWSYPNVSSCVSKSACSSTCAGFGIGGKLDRIDFVFASNRNGTLPKARILGAMAEDSSAVYSDHKALRVSIKH